MKLSEEQKEKLKDECYVSFIKKSEIEGILNGYEFLSDGSFASSYTDFSSSVIKRYFKNPYLKSKNGIIIFDYKDVVDNLINIFKISQKSAAIPFIFYVVDDELLMYKMPFMKGYNLNEISSQKKDLYLSDIKGAWKYAYYLACFFASNSITMYDLNPANCNIHDDKLLIYDLDFYKEEQDKRIILLNNYETVNICFANFFEDYYFDFCYETEIKDFSNNFFCDDFCDEFYDHLKHPCKTLKDAYKNLR